MTRSTSSDGESVTGPDEGDKRLRFEYDHMGRRIRKTAESYNGSSWDVDTHLYFVYEPSRWNVLLVLDAADGSDQGTEPDYKILRKYTWGLDMSGQYGNPSESGIHGAGNIGGLLACVETDHESNPDAGQYWFFYDANGNVTQVIYQDGSIKAHYEYDPYGHVINDLSSYTYADANPFRFSTKWLDDELATSESGVISTTGMYYYGYRYYSPSLGRWISRDPIEEDGGKNLCGFVKNSPTGAVDPRGRCGGGLLTRIHTRLACQGTIKGAANDRCVRMLELEMSLEGCPLPDRICESPCHRYCTSGVARAWFTREDNTLHFCPCSGFTPITVEDAKTSLRHELGRSWLSCLRGGALVVDCNLAIKELIFVLMVDGACGKEGCHSEPCEAICHYGKFHCNTGYMIGRCYSEEKCMEEFKKELEAQGVTCP